MSRAKSSSFQFHSPTCRLTDLSSQERRPVVVVSSDAYHRVSADVIVVAMTSKPAVVPYSFRIRSADLVEGALNRRGTVRVDKIYTLAKTIIVKKFGKVSPQVLERIRPIMADLIASKS